MNCFLIYYTCYIYNCKYILKIYWFDDRTNIQIDALLHKAAAILFHEQFNEFYVFDLYRKHRNFEENVYDSGIE